MVKLKEFLEQVAAIAAQNPRYELGGDGAGGVCDCIGLIIGAIRQAGGEWGGTHGSNYAARYCMKEMKKHLAAEELELGWAVYKAKAPSESGYNLPKTYEGHDDQLDYYHVGIVTGVEPLVITHCTKNDGIDGIATDSRQGKWIYGGPLTLVDYEGEAVSMATAIVRASSGSTVKMRAKASTQSGLYWNVPVGAQVVLLAQGNQWSQITWNGRKGFMQSRFLELEGEGATGDEEALVTLTMEKTTAAALAAALRNAGL
ncbi:MAG: SH3 domain-containing protein [Clostridia bacterium]|nr:SH3 domain-containing protein [Clostridia bacterium]